MSSCQKRKFKEEADSEELSKTNDVKDERFISSDGGDYDDDKYEELSSGGDDEDDDDEEHVAPKTKTNHNTQMIKWPISNYYAKKLPNGQAFVDRSRKNAGSGEYVPDPKGLQRLADDHGEEMVPLQIVATFILRYIHLLAYPTLVAGLLLTRHHGVPVADDCNGADIEANWFFITEGLHFVWHFCLQCLFSEQSHVYTMNCFINGANKPWNVTESTTILFAELARLLPALEAKGVAIPENIRAYAAQAISKNVISTEIQAAREAAHELKRQTMHGNNYGHGNLGKTHKMHKPHSNRGDPRPYQFGERHAAVHNWTDTRDRKLIDAVLHHGTKWQTIRRQYFADWFPEENKEIGRKALQNRWNALVKSKDKRIAEAKAKRGDVRSYFTAK